MIPEKKICSMLGLAQRAGRIESGEFSTEKAVKKGKASLVVVASDASGNTKKKFRDMCSYYGVSIRTGPEKEVLGHAIGCEMRASLAVTDSGFADAIAALMADVYEDKMTVNENLDGGSENGGAE